MLKIKNDLYFTEKQYEKCEKIGFVGTGYRLSNESNTLVIERLRKGFGVVILHAGHDIDIVMFDRLEKALLFAQSIEAMYSGWQSFLRDKKQYFLNI